jgi:hypothetical protein
MSALVCLASGCVSYEGRYAPSCPSYAGNTIELADGRFEWDKFTDQVRVDDQGNVVDAFPDYPRRGSYRLSRHKLSLTADDGEPLPTLYLVRQANRFYLYTEPEHEAWERTGEPAKCALVQGGAEDR